MNEKIKTTDELIDVEAIMEIHHRWKKVWVHIPLDELLERENALGAYVIDRGMKISEYLTGRGVPEDVVQRTQDAAMKGMLVCIQAHHDAHFELWRDMMGDPAPERSDLTGDTNKGEHNG